MTARQKKKLRKNRYERAIEEVALEVSMAPVWRGRLFAHPPETRFLISWEGPDDIPPYIRPLMARYHLMFYVSKVERCCEQFDSGLVIFKFESKEFPRIVRFSGNNPEVV